MNALLRCLRDGRLSDFPSAPVGLLQSTARDGASQLAFREVLAQLGTAIAEKRAQAQRLIVIALASPPESYASLAGLSACPLLTLNCFSDPWSWNQGFHADSERTAAAQALVLDIGDLSALKRELLTDGPGVCVAFDDLSTLVAAHGWQEILGLLAEMESCPHVSSCLAVLHLDRHTEQEALRLNALATGRLCMTVAAGPGSVDGLPMLRGQIYGQTVKKTGCLLVEDQQYRMSSAGNLSIMQKQAMPLQHLASTAAHTTLSGTQESTSLANDLMVQMDGGMKLSLTEQERAAKEQVVLPYEHRGSGGHETGDFRQYLPPAAGGVGAGAGKQKLGHILYARDSDDEECFSDEDPDEDLDI